MNFNKLIQEGIKIESEHKNTYQWLKHVFDESVAFPTAKEFYESIVLDHLDEDEQYYSKLKKIEKKKESLLREDATLRQLGNIMSSKTASIRLLSGPLGPAIISDIPRGSTPLEIYELLVKNKFIDTETLERIAKVTSRAHEDPKDPKIQKINGIKDFMRVGGPQGLVLAYFGYLQITSGAWATAVAALEKDMGAKWEDLLKGATRVMAGKPVKSI